MIRVGFTILDGKENWMGGINYLKNLLYAIAQLPDKQIYPILFVGRKTAEELIMQFDGLAEIKRDVLFDRKSRAWFYYIFMRDVWRRNPQINKIAREYNIQVFSHSYIYGPDIVCKTLNWIPDFQHVRLPHLYSKLHLAVRQFRLKSTAKYSDGIVLSSYDALNDFRTFAPNAVSKTRILHFVSQTAIYADKGPNYLKDKYQLADNYFFLPNQFWVHKNHRVAFEAVKLAIDKTPGLTLVCSGMIDDPRNVKYINSLKDFITNQHLERRIILLGLIPFSDVLLLMKHSISIINPSYFEGWSSSVEEAKSMGKKLILSDIPVHREQNPEKAVYFKPDDAGELAHILTEEWSSYCPPNDDVSNPANLIERTLAFGQQYQDIVLELYRPKNWN